MGHGDNPSTFLWATFLDILARCLASFRIQDFYVMKMVDGVITIVFETMYPVKEADMQHRADISEWGTG